MNVLVLFSSTEGQTRKVAEHVALQAKSAGHGAVVYDMGSDRSIPSIDAFDTVVCAASVHQGYHQESAIDFVAAQAKALNAKKSAFISVSLSAAMEDGRAEAQTYVDRFLEATGWKPAECLLLGGAIRLSSYDYFERQVMKFILRDKGDVQDMNVDYELTDWPALRKFVAAVLGTGQSRSPTVADLHPNE